MGSDQIPAWESKHKRTWHQAFWACAILFNGHVLVVAPQGLIFRIINEHPMSKSHVVNFFSSYSNFTLNRNAAPTKEFLRLKKQYDQWKGGNKKYAKARELFADAVAEDFNAKFGTDVNNIDHWHALCHVLRIHPVPRNICASRRVRALVKWARHWEPSYSCFFPGCQVAVKANQPR